MEYRGRKGLRGEGGKGVDDPTFAGRAHARIPHDKFAKDGKPR